MSENFPQDVYFIVVNWLIQSAEEPRLHLVDIIMFDRDLRMCWTPIALEFVGKLMKYISASKTTIN